MGQKPKKWLRKSQLSPRAQLWRVLWTSGTTSNWRSKCWLTLSTLGKFFDWFPIVFSKSSTVSLLSMNKQFYCKKKKLLKNNGKKIEKRTRTESKETRVKINYGGIKTFHFLPIRMKALLFCP